MSEDHFFDLAGKRLSNNLDEVEERLFDDLIADSRAHRELYEQLRSAWNEDMQDWRITNSDHVFERIMENARGEGETARRKLYNQEEEQVRQPVVRSWWAAASVALLAMAGFFGFWIHQQWQRQVAEVPDVQWILKSNPKGQKSAIRLPDGTLVKLNANSYLEFPEQFSDSLREVRLVGEAFFDVEEDTLRPFMVISGDNATRVLGTSFNIKAFPYDYNYRVSVVTGKVEVLYHETVLGLLEKDKMLIYNHRDGWFKTSGYDPMNELAWKDGILYFHKSRTRKIKKTLERWYGVDLVVVDSLEIDGYTGTFDNATLEEVLQGMAYASNFRFRIEGKKVYIY